MQISWPIWEVLASPFIKINAIHSLKWCVVCQKSIPSAEHCQEQQRWTGNRSPWTRPFLERKSWWGLNHIVWSFQERIAGAASEMILILSFYFSTLYCVKHVFIRLLKNNWIRQFHVKLALFKRHVYMEVTIIHLPPHCYFSNFEGFPPCTVLAQD